MMIAKTSIVVDVNVSENSTVKVFFVKDQSNSEGFEDINCFALEKSESINCSQETVNQAIMLAEDFVVNNLGLIIIYHNENKYNQ